ncbi:MAG: multiprotein bridging factor aMBF1 [Candidatus Nanohaloarchaea archaeon]|nr:multiprotein bridging factor aMBF1 [Candidatus Nanohaloarchaea archaeon]
MQCEMCGQDAELKETKVEGATLKLCEDCQETGEVVETEDNTSSRRSSGSGSSRGSSKSSRSKPRQQQEELVRDYNTKVREAREEEGWGTEELADKLNEKESVVHRIESGKLKPDKRLAQKIKNQLEVELYQDVAATDYEGGTGTSEEEGATIGDVAEVTKKED